MEKTKISVVVPFFNSSKTLHACLKKILNSDYPDFEVIAVDDGSTDNSAEIVKEFPVKLIRLKKNSGPAKARNTGAKKALGEIIVFVDSDVLINKENLSLFKKTFEGNPKISCVQAIYSDSNRYRNFATRYQDYYHIYTFGVLREGMIPTVASYNFAIKRDVFEKLGGFDENIKSPSVEDDDLGHRLSKGGYEIFLNKKISCQHLNHTSVKKLLKRNFSMAFSLAKLMLRNRHIKNRKTPSNIHPFMIFGIPISFFAILFLILSYFNPIFFAAFFITLLIFLFVNLRYLLFIRRKSGFTLALWSYFFTFLNLFISGIAVFLGFFGYFMNRY